MAAASINTNGSRLELCVTEMRCIEIACWWARDWSLLVHKEKGISCLLARSLARYSTFINVFLCNEKKLCVSTFTCTVAFCAARWLNLRCYWAKQSKDDEKMGEDFGGDVRGLGVKFEFSENSTKMTKVAQNSLQPWHNFCTRPLWWMRSR